MIHLHSSHPNRCNFKGIGTRFTTDPAKVTCPDCGTTRDNDQLAITPQGLATLRALGYDERGMKIEQPAAK